MNRWHSACTSLRLMAVMSDLPAYMDFTAGIGAAHICHCTDLTESGGPLMALPSMLKGLPDMERGITRIFHCTANPAEFAQVLHALVQVAPQLGMQVSFCLCCSDALCLAKHACFVRMGACMLKHVTSLFCVHAQTPGSTIAVLCTLLLSWLPASCCMSTDRTL